MKPILPYKGPVKLVGADCTLKSQHQWYGLSVPVCYMDGDFLLSGLENSHPHYWTPSAPPHFRQERAKTAPEGLHVIIHPEILLNLDLSDNSPPHPFQINVWDENVLDNLDFEWHAHLPKHFLRWGLFWVQSAQHEFLESLSCELPYVVYYHSNSKGKVLCQLTLEHRVSKSSLVEIMFSFVSSLIFKEFYKIKPNFSMLDVLFFLLMNDQQPQWEYWSSDLLCLFVQHQIQIGDFSFAKNIEAHLRSCRLPQGYFDFLDNIKQELQCASGSQGRPALTFRED